MSEKGERRYIPIEPSNNKGPSSICFRMEDDDRAKIAKAANEQGASVTGLIRESGLMRAEQIAEAAGGMDNLLRMYREKRTGQEDKEHQIFPATESEQE